MVEALKRTFLVVSAMFAVMLIVVACGSADASPTASGGSASAGDIVVSGAWTRPMTASMPGMSMPSSSPGSMDMGGMSMPSGSPVAMDMSVTDAVYFTIKNNSKESDQLVSAASDVAASTEMHQSTLVNGISSMKPVSEVDVPAGGSVSFDPGNYHVMLVGLHRDLNVGDHFDLTLTFKQAGDVNVSVEVRPN
jgi:copper(I)-binding protein